MSNTIPSVLDGPRQAHSGERDDIIAFLNLVFRTAAGREPTIATDWPHIYAPGNPANVIGKRSAGRLVASTGVWVNDIALGSSRLRVGGINCVGVLPELRKKGVGALLMQEAHRYMTRLGCHIGLLVTDLDNWYRALGWERAASKRLYRIDLGNAHLLPQLPADVALRPAGDDGLDDLLRLHAADRLGGVRTPDMLCTLLQAKKHPAQLVLATRGDRALAYLLAQGPVVTEWGGAAEIIAGLARSYLHQVDNTAVSRSQRDASFKAMRLQSITVTTPARGHAFIDLLDSLRIPFNLDYYGMICVLDPAAILRAFACDDISVSEKDGLFHFRRGEQSLAVNRNQMAKLLFGPERVSPFASDVFPLPFCQWALEIT